MAENSLDALALIEIDSIARGYSVMDGLAKRARVTVKWAKPVTPGKFIILFAGEIASAEEAMLAAQEIAGTHLLGTMFLPQVHSELLAALAGNHSQREMAAVAVVELSHVWSTLEGADLALKAAEVGLIQMTLAAGIGGKGYFVLVGEHADILAAHDAIKGSDLLESLIAIEVIANPQPDICGFFK